VYALQVIAVKGEDNPAVNRPGRGGHNALTACGNAAGDMMPPFFTFTGKDTTKLRTRGTAANIKFSLSDNGWPDNPSWYRWCVGFVAFIKKLGLTQALLICDNGDTHSCLAAIQLLRDNNVRLWCLPPASTSKMQPLDAGYFGGLQAVVASEIDARFGRVTEGDIPALVTLAYERMASTAHNKGKPGGLVAAFAKCGLFPCNPEIFTDADFLRSDRIHGYSATHEDVVKANKLTSADFSVIIDSTTAIHSPAVTKRLKEHVHRSGFDLNMVGSCDDDTIQFSLDKDAAKEEEEFQVLVRKSEREIMKKDREDATMLKRLLKEAAKSSGPLEKAAASFAPVGGAGVQPAMGKVIGTTSQALRKHGKAHGTKAHTTAASLVPIASIPRALTELAGSKRMAVDISGGRTAEQRPIKAPKFDD